jgi:hypothetical protein
MTQEKQKAIGVVKVRRFDARTGHLTEERVFPNTVLKSGRRFLMAAVGGNLLTDSFKAWIDRMAFGVGGVDMGGNVIPVSENQTGFIGGASNVKDMRSVQNSLSIGDKPGIIVSSMLPADSPANGFQVTQIGLVFSDGTYYSVSTWLGFPKDSLSYHVIDWEISLL